MVTIHAYTMAHTASAWQESADEFNAIIPDWEAREFENHMVESDDYVSESEIEIADYLPMPRDWDVFLAIEMYLDPIVFRAP